MNLKQPHCISYGLPPFSCECCMQGTRMLSRYKTGLQGHNTEADLETRQSRFHFDLPCQRHHLYHTAAVRQSDTKL